MTEYLKRLKKRLHGKKSQTKRRHQKYQDELTGKPKRRENHSYTVRMQAFNEAIDMVEKEIQKAQQEKDQKW